MPVPASVQGANPQQMVGWDRYVEAATPPLNAGTQAYKQNFSSALPGTGVSEPFIKQWAYQLTVGTTVTVLSDSEVPDYWYIWTPAATSVLLTIQQGPQNGGVGLMISGGGMLKLPGRSEYVTVTNGQTALSQGGMSNVQGMVLSTALVNIVATRGLCFEVDAGNVA